MRSAAELIDCTKRLGVSLRAEGERIRYRPASSVPPDLLEELRSNKRALLKILRAPEMLRAGQPWPGSWWGWAAAFRHEARRLYASGMPFDEAEDRALAALPDPPAFTWPPPPSAGAVEHQARLFLRRCCLCENGMAERLDSVLEAHRLDALSRCIEPLGAMVLEKALSALGHPIESRQGRRVVLGLALNLGARKNLSSQEEPKQEGGE